jgi:hypothetical protein
MRDIKIYLHSKSTRLQSLVHVIAAACFFLKASQLPPNAFFYLFWFYFYSSFGVLLVVVALFQAANKFTYQYLAVIMNILAGVVLIVESLVKLTVAENLIKFTHQNIIAYLVSILGGLFFILMGIFEDRIRKIRYMAFNRNQIYGRRSWFSSFTFPWEEIAEVSFRRNRVKIVTRNGRTYRYRVAKQSAGGIMFKSAAYFCQQILLAQNPNQKAPPAN